MKKALFWVIMLPLTVPVVIFGLLSFLVRWCNCFIEVSVILLERYEHWSFDVPKGTFVNCPWRYSLKEVWLKEYNS